MSSVPLINDKIENNLVAVILNSPSSIGLSESHTLRIYRKDMCMLVCRNFLINIFGNAGLMNIKMVYRAFRYSEYCHFSEICLLK